MEQHELLSDFMPISEGVETMKAAGKVLLEEFALMTETTMVLKQDRMKFMERIHASEKSIKGQIRKTRDRLNRHLDLIEQKLTKKLKLLVEKSEREFLKDQHDIQMIESDVKKMKGNVALSLNNEGDVALISGLVDEKNAFQSKIMAVREQQKKVPTTVLQFRISNAILEFMENTQEFGKVTLQMPFDEYDEFSDSSPIVSNKYPSPILPSKVQSNAYLSSISPLWNQVYPRSIVQRYPGSCVKNKYGMHESNPYHSFNAQFNQHRSNGAVSYRNEFGNESVEPYSDFESIREDRFILSSDHEGPCHLSGVAALTSGRVVVCDSKHKSIQLINRSSEVLDELVFHYKPCDIATISENGVVVSFIEKDFISVFNASTRALSHKRNVSVSGRGGSYSLAYCKNKFAVCRRGEIRILSSDDGTLIKMIQTEAHFPQIAMSDGGSKIYLSDYVGGKVVCMNELGKSKWEYSEADLEPCSLAVDLNQLFIADIKGKIYIMSTYGILVRALNCHGRLHAICLDPNSGTLLVTQENSRDKAKSRSITLVSI